MSVGGSTGNFVSYTESIGIGSSVKGFASEDVGTITVVSASSSGATVRLNGVRLNGVRLAAGDEQPGASGAFTANGTVQIRFN